MSAVNEREQFLRAFHDAHPGITSAALARTGCYERLAARVPAGDVLDLACGDGRLLRLLGSRAIGLDLSRGELAVASSTGQVVQARAQALPFCDHRFDAATCHLAFMLFDDVEVVVSELSRVLRPGARFLALLGGGPSAEGDDAFHRFARLMPRSGRRFGDRRASTEAGWRELFAIGRPDGWRDLAFERWPLDLGGRFDEVWRFLGASYQLADAERVRDALREEFPGQYVPCTVVTYLATVTR
jgi:SAM-dependent methyltransferase